MSGRVVSQFVLICDGCKTEREPAQTATEARAVAWSQGWRFPPRRVTDGRQAREADDVCPDCLPGHEPTLTHRARRAKP